MGCIEPTPGHYANSNKSPVEDNVRLGWNHPAKFSQPASWAQPANFSKPAKWSVGKRKSVSNRTKKLECFVGLRGGARKYEVSQKRKILEVGDRTYKSFSTEKERDDRQSHDGNEFRKQEKKMKEKRKFKSMFYDRLVKNYSDDSDDDLSSISSIDESPQPFVVYYSYSKQGIELGNIKWAEQVLEEYFQENESVETLVSQIRDTVCNISMMNNNCHLFLNCTSNFNRQHCENAQ